MFLVQKRFNQNSKISAFADFFAPVLQIAVYNLAEESAP